jgi:hypothetical protein
LMNRMDHLIHPSPFIRSNPYRFLAFDAVVKLA